MNDVKLVSPPRSYTAARHAISTGWDFAPLGPWPVGTVIEHVSIWGHVTGAMTVRVSGGICGTPDLSIANVAGGTPLVLHSDLYQDGVPILQLPMGAATTFLLPFAVNHTVRTGPRWVVLAFQADESLETFTVLASATVAIQAYGAVPVVGAPPATGAAAPGAALGAGMTQRG